MSYHVRPATLADIDVLVRHRIAMFSDMGVPIDGPPLALAFAEWLRATMASETYRAWLVETAEGQVAAGGGATIIPWPPGPRSLGDKIAFVYNVYTEPPHRRRGLARLVMEAIHEWCQWSGVGTVALNASSDGQSLYDSMGYTCAPNPMMVFSLSGYNPSAQG